MLGPEDRIAETFNRHFADFDIRIEADDVVFGRRGEIRAQGWRITFRIDTDDAGAPSLEFYATHRMTSDRHMRIWGDGHEDELDAIYESYGYDSKVPGAEEAAREEYLRHNRMVTEQLVEAGLYPDGDINAYLRTGGDLNESEDGSAGGREEER
jgi:hypothetical protein